MSGREKPYPCPDCGGPMLDDRKGMTGSRWFCANGHRARMIDLIRDEGPAERVLDAPPGIQWAEMVRDAHTEGWNAGRLWKHTEAEAWETSQSRALLREAGFNDTEPTP